MSDQLGCLLVTHYQTGNVQPASNKGRVVVGTEADLRAVFPMLSPGTFTRIPDGPIVHLRDYLAEQGYEDLLPAS